MFDFTSYLSSWITSQGGGTLLAEASLPLFFVLGRWGDLPLPSVLGLVQDPSRLRDTVFQLWSIWVLVYFGLRMLWEFEGLGHTCFKMVFVRPYANVYAV